MQGEAAAPPASSFAAASSFLLQPWPQCLGAESRLGGNRDHRSGVASMGTPAEPLGALCRAYIYAIHGHLAEMLFATVVMGGEWAFRGAADLWPLLLYGPCGLALEGVHRLLRADCCLLTRCALYTLCIFLGQLGLGALLRAFAGGCPWDYGGFRFSLWGLVALEHSLVWFVGSLLLERLVIRSALRLRLAEPWKAAKGPTPRFELHRD